MGESRICPECRAEMRVDAPEGLCPECLFNQVIACATGRGDEQQATTPRTDESIGDPPRPDELARYFPQLEILELQGRGGMVYRARQIRLDRLVALKIMPPVLGGDAAFAERFAREARALAKLSHPRIVGVHDFGESGGLFYLLMEFVDGVSLRGFLRQGKLKPVEALRIVPQICEALQYAHEEGIVHRDIKPENILLDRRGNVKIADFGLAKLVGATSPDSALTGSRQVLGTLRYMAPEQMESPLEVDHRADIYALGVVFYEMLTGELPIGRFAPPSEKAEVDRRLDRVIFRALEARPDRRYQRASEVKDDVQSLSVTTDLAGLHSKKGLELTADERAGTWLPPPPLVVFVAMSIVVVCVLAVTTAPLPLGVAQGAVLAAVAALFMLLRDKRKLRGEQPWDAMPASGVETQAPAVGSPIGRFLAIVAVLVCWIPTLGLALGGIAWIVNRNVPGWPKTSSMIGTYIAAFFTIWNMIVMVLQMNSRLHQ